MFPSITVFIMYPAVIPTVCVCVCVHAALQLREIKSIRRLYKPLKLSAFCLCVRLIVQFSILSFSVVFPYIQSPWLPWTHDQFLLLFLLCWFSLPLPTLFLSLCLSFSFLLCLWRISALWSWKLVAPNCCFSAFCFHRVVFPSLQRTLSFLRDLAKPHPKPKNKSYPLNCPNVGKIVSMNGFCQDSHSGSRLSRRTHNQWCQRV